MGLSAHDATLVWHEIIWPRPCDADELLARFRLLADDPTMPLTVLEIRARQGRVRYLAGGRPQAIAHILDLLNVPSVPVDAASLRPSVTAARRLTVSAQDRPLDVTNPAAAAQVILKALTEADKDDEQLVVQVVLGPRLHAVTSSRRSEVAFSWQEFRFTTRPVDATAKALRDAKTSLPGFRCDVRVGVSAATPARRQRLALNLLGTMKHLETPGVRLDYRPLDPASIGEDTSLMVPRLWPLSLNLAEAAALCAPPVGDADYPGLPAIHPRLLPTTNIHKRVDDDHALVALSTAPATLDQPLVRSTEALLHHLHVLGPTGTGKSVTLLNLALQDIEAGRSVVVIEPKGDLVEDILERLPQGRVEDVVVFDPLDRRGVVGLNPLDGNGASRLKADGLYSIFADLFADSLGVRTADILHASLLTLARRPDASLIQLPLLLSNPTLRRRLTASVMGDLALGPFWAWYENLHEAEQANVIAPLMNKLRALILDPVIRRVIGQTAPRFRIDQVLAGRKVLLVPLPVDKLGEQGASLLGSLLIGQLWAATQRRANVPVSERRPVAVYVDEAQRFLHLGADLSDVLATSRSYGVGWTLAHQYLGQLPPELRTAVLANCRSRIGFQLAREDAEAIAKTAGGLLEPEDFTGLTAYHVYASIYDAGRVQPYASGRTLPAPAICCDAARLRRQSAEHYGRPADEIEAQFASWQALHSVKDERETGEYGMRVRSDYV